jgi:predicted nucleic acid-binding Zn ribbon protein
MADGISIGDAIRQFLSKSRLKGSMQALQIHQVWEQLMGKTIAKYTDRIEIYNGTLFISTTVAPLKQELLYQKEQILLRVNEALGEKAVREVVIR